MAMTTASRGRSTKMAESMPSAPADRRLHRGRAHRRPGAHGLQAVDDHELASGEALVDDDARARRAARLDALDHRLAVLDHEDIDAGLIGDEGCLRDHHLL